MADYINRGVTTSNYWLGLGSSFVPHRIAELARAQTD